MKKVFMLAFVVLAVVACNKDQAAVKKLDGTWNITKMEIEIDLFGTALKVDLIAEGGSGTMTFNGCKLKKDEWCTVGTTLTAPEGFGGETEESNDLYRVTGDGTTLEVKENDTSSVTSMTIVELTKEDLKVNFTDPDLGPVEAELKKQ